MAGCLQLGHRFPELTRPFRDLLLEAAVRLAQLDCHAVEGLGKLLQFIAGSNLDALIQGARAYPGGRDV